MTNSSTPLNEGRWIEHVPLAGGSRLVTAPVRAMSFWVAVALPFAYLPLLWGDLSGQNAQLFLALLFANAGALLVGHDYNR
jgi:hypothetical protein